MKTTLRPVKFYECSEAMVSLGFTLLLRLCHVHTASNTFLQDLGHVYTASAHDLYCLPMLNISQSNGRWDDYNFDAMWKTNYALIRDQKLNKSVNFCKFKVVFYSFDRSSMLATKCMICHQRPTTQNWSVDKGSHLSSTCYKIGKICRKVAEW